MNLRDVKKGKQKRRWGEAREGQIIHFFAWAGHDVMNFTLLDIVGLLVNYWLIILIYSISMYSIATSGEVSGVQYSENSFETGINSRHSCLAYLESAGNSWE